MLRSFFRRWLSPGARAARPAGRRRRAQLFVEPLEERRLMHASIQWVDRDNTTFEDVFGGQANAAREVIDAALKAWENIIVSFNYPDASLNDTLKVEIEMDTSETGGGAVTFIEGTEDGLPTDGEIEIATAEDVGGWFLDPTPNESSEFRGTLINAFVGGPTPGGPTAGRPDLFNIVATEMAHVVGLCSSTFFADPAEHLLFDENPLFVETGVTDLAFPGEGHLWTFLGPSGETALYTSNNGGVDGSDRGEPLHVAEPTLGNSITDANNITYFGAQDVNNATYEGSRRYLPSRLDALILHDIYGYTIDLDQLHNFYADLDGNGNLLIRGGQYGESVYTGTSNSNDHVTLRRSGDQLIVSVDVGKNVEGTAADGPWVATFTWADVQSITIDLTDQLNGAPIPDGDDTITLDNSDGPVLPAHGFSINAGNGANKLQFIGTDQDDVFESLPGQMFVNGAFIPYSGDSIQQVEIDGGRGMDSIQVGVGAFLSGETQLLIDGGDDADTITVADTGFLDFLTIQAGDGDDHIGLRGTNTVTLVSIFGDAGNDVIVAAEDGHELSSLQGNLFMDGGADLDTLEVHDEGHTFGSDYAITQFSVTYGSRSIAYFQLETLELNSSSSSSNFEVLATASGTATILNGGPEADLFLIDADPTGPADTVDGVQSYLTINGNGGADQLTLQDKSDGTADQITITDQSIGAAFGDTFFGQNGRLFYHDMAQVTLEGGGGGNLIDVLSTPDGTPVMIHAGQGSDYVVVGGVLPGREELPQAATVDGVRSNLLLDGQDGINTLAVDDSSDPTGDVATLTAFEIGTASGDTFFAPGGSLRYVTFQHLSLSGGSGGNLIKVQNTAVLTQTVAVNAGAGNDRVRIGAPGANGGRVVSGIHSGLSVHGQAGSDQVYLEDGGDLASTLVTLDDGHLGDHVGDSFFGSGGGLSYDTLERLTLDAGASKDTINVRGTSAGTATYLNTAGGNDQVNIDTNGSPLGGTVQKIVSLVAVNGGPGVNRLSVDDSGDAIHRQVTITDKTVGAGPGDNFFGPGGSLSYNHLSQLTLNASEGGNTVYVNSSAHQTDTTINGGMNADLFFVGLAAGSKVDGVRGKLTINGLGGLDQLVVDDSNNQKPKQVSLQPGQIGTALIDHFFGQGGSLFYSGIHSLLLNTGSGGDVVNVLGQAAGTATTVNAGSGKDQVNVFVNPNSNYHQFVVNGGQPGGSLGDILRVIVSGSPVVKKVPNGPNDGFVEVDYGGGLVSHIDYLGMETVLT